MFTGSITSEICIHVNSAFFQSLALDLHSKVFPQPEEQEENRDG
jgi:hypothetical protein